MKLFLFLYVQSLDEGKSGCVYDLLVEYIFSAVLYSVFYIHFFSLVVSDKQIRLGLGLVVWFIYGPILHLVKAVFCSILWLVIVRFRNKACMVSFNKKMLVTWLCG